MQEDLEQKSVSLVINTSKLTGRTLAKAFMSILRYTHNKVRQHRQMKPQGKQSVKKLIGQNQGVEKAEIADKEEMKKFDHIAKKYHVDYAIRKGVSEKGEPRYMLFFKARDRAAIDQVFATYAADWKQRDKEERPSLRKTLQELMSHMSHQQKDKNKEMVR